MCTFIILQGMHPDFPVVIAANRDEFFGRRAKPPSRWPQTDNARPHIVAGIDEKSGGTWLGVTSAGFYVGLTNQRKSSADIEAASRGPIVRLALELGDSGEVKRMLEDHPPRSSNPFNLLFGDAGGVSVAYSHHDLPNVVIEAVPTGVQVLPNDRLNSPGFSKVDRAHKLMADADIATLSWSGLQVLLKSALSDHKKPSLDSLPEAPGSLLPRTIIRQLDCMCVHTPVYGTRSATISALGAGRILQHHYADGRPCSTPFSDLAALVC